MAGSDSIFTKFITFVFFYLSLSCFTPSASSKSDRFKDKRKPLGSTPRDQPMKSSSSSLSIVKRIFLYCSFTSDVSVDPCKSHIVGDRPPCTNESSSTSHQLNTRSSQEPLNSMETDLHVISPSKLSPLRNNIFPCTLCGEVFQSARVLVRHRTTAHAVSALQDSDPGKNVVHIIFQAGWMSKTRFPVIHRILKIHTSQKLLSRFEEHREMVKCKAAKSGTNSTRRDERCIADGNELLRFVCSTFVCNLGANRSFGLCDNQYCSVCNIIRCGFSSKMDGIPVFSTAIAAHEAVPEDVEEEFRFINVKRVILVCRVVAGRVGYCGDTLAESGGAGFDSVLRGRNERQEGGDSDNGGRGFVRARMEAEELVVFNPRAVLPCFVIVYTA